MLQLRPNCECCNTDLPPHAVEAMICSFECTFCSACATQVLHGICPNCAGNWSDRCDRRTRLLEYSAATTDLQGRGLFAVMPEALELTAPGLNATESVLCTLKVPTDSARSSSGHSRARGNPGGPRIWIPACAGMTFHALVMTGAARYAGDDGTTFSHPCPFVTLLSPQHTQTVRLILSEVWVF